MAGVYFGKVCTVHPELKGERNQKARVCAECHRIKKRAWAKKGRNRDKAASMVYSRLRFAKILQAIPPWADKIKIAAIYASRSPGQVVDHVIPLKGVNPKTGEHIVCGLHVEHNLSVSDHIHNGQKWAWFDADAHSHSIPAVV